MGTLQYMSPEQVQGAENVDARSDIFALGAILYELVTGQRAFEGKSDFEVMGAIVAGRYPLVRERAPDVDPVLAEAIRRALEVRAEARFQSCEEFVKALEAPVPTASDSPQPVQEPPGADVAPPAAQKSESRALNPSQVRQFVSRGLVELSGPTAKSPVRTASAELSEARPQDAPRKSVEPRGKGTQPKSQTGVATGPNYTAFVIALLVFPAAVVVALMFKDFSSFWQHEPAGKMVSVAGGSRVAPFLLDVTEVTVAAYAACVKAGKCTEPDTGYRCNWRVAGKEQHPINCVDWTQADAYCKAQGKRLPDHAEWQFAASNGGRTQFPWGDSSPDATRAKWNSDDGTAPVGSFPAGATQSGLQDLSGNVWEWMANDYSSGGKELRGGSWGYDDADGLRASSRLRSYPTDQGGDFGFRCAQ